MYLRHYEPDRWPAGNPETGYLDCDAGATKSFILEARRRDPADKTWALCFGPRAPEELYDLKKDPDCLRNLAGSPEAAAMQSSLSGRMNAELSAQGDPRQSGNGAVFDQYEHANRGHVGFYEKFMDGRKVKAGWINESDIEPQPLKP